MNCGGDKPDRKQACHIPFTSPDIQLRDIAPTAERR
jgi:hypothetical protein